MAACDAAFSTCEILEHVIAYLPAQRILVVERVCKTWQKLINNSKDIARTRCLARLPTDAGVPGSFRPAYEVGSAIRYRPSLGPLPSTCFYADLEGKEDLGDEEDLESEEYLEGKGSLQMCDRCFRIEESHNLAQYHSAGTDEYLTNPRIEALRVVVVCSSVNDRQRVVIRNLHASEGLRMEDLHAAEGEALKGLGKDFSTCTIFGICYEVMESSP